MNILALDSTAITAAVAICSDEKLICSYTANNGNTHSENLLPMVESALKLARMTASDIDLFVCSAGPGSFTGVRIGAATLKGLAFGTGKPCAGISTLEALAHNLDIVSGRAIISPVMNARRAQVYNALFMIEDGVITRLTEDRVLSVAELEEELLEKYSGLPLYLSGDGYDITRELFKSLSPMKTPEHLIYQNGYSVAMAGLRAFKSGAFTDDMGLSPTYLRPSQAERTLAEKMAKEKDKQ